MDDSAATESTRQTLRAHVWDAFVSQQFTAPAIAILLVTSCYWLSGSFEFPSVLVITPVVAVTGLWMGLSETRKFTSVLALAVTFLWLFVLWYALVRNVLSGTSIPYANATSGINFWRFQATFLSIVGATTVVVVLLRVFTRIRLTSTPQPDWSNRCRWGMLDLMALSFGVAMIVAAANLRGDTRIIIVSSIVAAAFSLSTALFWWALSRGRALGWMLACVSLALHAYCGVLALNSLEWSWSGRFEYLLTNLPSLETSNLAAVGFFALLTILPCALSVWMGHRLVAFPRTQSLGFAGRLLQRTLFISLTGLPIVLALLIAVVPWQHSETVRTAGWPLYYSQISQHTVSTNYSNGGTVIRHVAIQSPARLGINLALGLVPFLPIVGWWFFGRRREETSGRWASFLPALSWCWLLGVYFLPALAFQKLASDATQGERSHTLSLLTQSWDDRRSNVMLTITNVEDLERLLAIPGGCRVSSLQLLGLTLNQQHLDRLAENHALISFTLTQCDLVGDLDGFIGHPHLEELTLEQTDVSARGQAAFQECPALRSLTLFRPQTPWDMWPKTVEALSIGCEPETASEWRILNLPSLQRLTIRDATRWWLDPTTPKTVVQPTRTFSVIDCGSPWVDIETSLPVKLRFLGTSPRALVGSRSPPYALGAKIAHYCDLRSLECDDVSQLRFLEACVASCESLVLTPATNLAAPALGGTSVVLQGIPLPADLQLDLTPIHPQRFAPQNALQSGRVLQTILETLSPASLAAYGMTVPSEQLDALATNPNLLRLNLQGNLPANALDKILAMRRLTSLRLVGVAPTDKQFSTLLSSLPSLEKLSIEGQNIQLPNLSKSTSLLRLSLLTEQIPPFRLADVGRLDSLVLGSQFASDMIGTETLFVTDVDVPEQLLKDWLKTHRDSNLDLKNAMSSFGKLRGLDFTQCQLLFIAPNSPDLEVMKTWQGEPPTQVHFFDQPENAIRDAELQAWMRENLVYFSLDADPSFGRGW